MKVPINKSLNCDGHSHTSEFNVRNMCLCDQQTNNVTPTNMFGIMYASYFQIQLRDDTHMKYTKTVNTEQILP